jgi:hypothetical protein
MSGHGDADLADSNPAPSWHREPLVLGPLFGAMAPLCLTPRSGHLLSAMFVYGMFGLSAGIAFSPRLDLAIRLFTAYILVALTCSIGLSLFMEN